MNKKYFGALLFGALTLASTTTFVSCSDYDDDINNLQEQIDALTPKLTEVKAELDQKLVDLKTQLEAKDAELAAAIEANKTANAENADKIVALTGSVAALEARIATAESAIENLNTLVAGKVDKTVFDATVADLNAQLAVITGNITTLSTNLTNEESARKAADANLQEQLDVLNAFMTKVEGYDIPAVKDAVATLTTKVADLETAVAGIKAQIGDLNYEDLKKQLADLDTAINAVAAEVNALNVLLDKSLRSIVFQPQAYYWGVEAARIYTLNYNTWKLPAVSADEKSKTEVKNHDRYVKGTGFKVLSFFAQYHMNPSSADLTDAQVSVIADDKDYINTRAYAAGLTVKNWNTTDKAGMLTVNLNVANQDAVREVLKDQEVTVFATQVKVNKAGKDTTITSDYATLYKESIADLVLTHKNNKSAKTATGVENTHCGDCSLTDNLNHLMQTAYEASYDFAPQDTCDFDKTLDLSTLVEVHYTTIEGKHAKLSATDLKANGIKIVYELTSLFMGGNNTSESAHAAINPEDGVTFRPQMPAAGTGKQQAYGAEQARATIGRTPLVRVSLVDTESGVVYDYGYIRIRISETKPFVNPEADKYIEYTGAGWEWHGDCSPKDWSFATTWIQAEYDLFHMLNITREEFEANYTAEEDVVTGTLNQYALGTNKKFVESLIDYGTITETTEPSADGTLTDVLKWYISGNDAYNYFVTQNKKEIAVAIKYVSADVYKYPHVFVLFKTGAPITVDYPFATVSWGNNKIKEYWYTRNSNNEGYDEIHTNVITPEDNAGGLGNVMDNRFSDVFVGNVISANKLIGELTDLTPAKDYAKSKLILDVIFDASNKGRQVKGNDGRTYKLGVTNNGLTLTATYGATTQNIAQIEYDGAGTTVENRIVNYLHTDFAHAILNYKDVEPAYEDGEKTSNYGGLGDNVLTATIALTAKTKVCDRPLALSDNTFDVRFLRPINAWNNNTVIEDASTQQLQTINLESLLKFKDWRAAWKSDYKRYYGINRIYIDGVADGQRISANSNVMCTLNGNEKVSLSTITTQLDFVYHATGNILEYRNLSSTVKSFKLFIPVTVEYFWGTITREATIEVKSTHANATAKPRN